MLLIRIPHVGVFDTSGVLTWCVEQCTGYSTCGCVQMIILNVWTLKSTLYIQIPFVPHREHTALLTCSGTCLFIVGAVRKVLTSSWLDVMVWVMDVASLGLGVIPSGLDVMPRRRIKTYLVPFIFSIRRYKELVPEDEGNTVARNVGNHLPICTVSCPRRTESSAAPLWEPDMWQCKPRLCSLDRKIIFNMSRAWFYQSICVAGVVIALRHLGPYMGVILAWRCLSMYSGPLAVEPEYTSPDWFGAWWLGKECHSWGNKITSGDSNRCRLLGIEAYAWSPSVSVALEFKPTL